MVTKSFHPAKTLLATESCYPPEKKKKFQKDE